MDQKYCRIVINKYRRFVVHYSRDKMLVRLFLIGCLAFVLQSVDTRLLGVRDVVNFAIYGGPLVFLARWLSSVGVFVGADMYVVLSFDAVFLWVALWDCRNASKAVVYAPTPSLAFSPSKGPTPKAKQKLNSLKRLWTCVFTICLVNGWLLFDHAFGSEVQGAQIMITESGVPLAAGVVLSAVTCPCAALSSGRPKLATIVAATLPLVAPGVFTCPHDTLEVLLVCMLVCHRVMCLRVTTRRQASLAVIFNHVFALVIAMFDPHYWYSAQVLASAGGGIYCAQEAALAV